MQEGFLLEELQGDLQLLPRPAAVAAAVALATTAVALAAATLAVTATAVALATAAVAIATAAVAIATAAVAIALRVPNRVQEVATCSWREYCLDGHSGWPAVRRERWDVRAQ